MKEQICYYCKKRLSGRTDKKFCNEFCRNCFHNEKRKTELIGCVIIINRKLKFNRNLLLEQLDHAESTVVFKRVLTNKGFSFIHFTHQVKDKKNVAWSVCYDIAYRVVRGIASTSVIIKHVDALKE